MAAPCSIVQLRRREGPLSAGDHLAPVVLLAVEVAEYITSADRTSSSSNSFVKEGATPVADR